MSGWRIWEGLAQGAGSGVTMVRRACLALILAVAGLVPVPVAAGPDGLISKAELLELVYAGDMEGVEQALDTAQRLYLDEAIPADEVRRLFEDFTTTNPRIISFTGDWAEAMPESPYAATARAWVFYRIAGLTRGKRTGWDTYPVAMEQFEALSDAGMMAASTAYTLAPDLLPASDAILRLANGLGAASYGYEIMDEVMQDRPNLGTLLRGLELTAPGYGGRAIMADAMCAYYGPQLNTPENEAVRYCRIVGLFEHHLRGRRELLEDLLDGFEVGHDPIQSTYIDYVRAKLAMLDWQNPDRLRQYQDVIQAYFDKHEVMDVDMAQDFDLFFGHMSGHRLVQGEVTQRAHEHALTAIQDDPYDPWFLHILETGKLAPTRTDDGLRVSFVTRLTAAERREILRKRLVASPFEPDHWSNMADSLEAGHRGDRPELDTLFASDPYRINAIVYGNHRAEYLIDFIKWKIIQLDVIARLTQVNTTPLVRPAPSYDLDADVICPLLRTARVLGVINSYNDRPETDGLTAIEAGQIRTLSDQARNEGRCAEVRRPDPVALAFEPVEVQLEVPPLVDQL